VVDPTPTPTPAPEPTPVAVDLDPSMLETLVSIDQRLGLMFAVMLVGSTALLFLLALYIVARMHR